MSQDKNIVTKVDAILDNKQSQSKVDRMLDPRDLLMDYLSTHVKEVQAMDPLIKKIKDDFIGRFEELSDGLKLNLLQMLLKKQSEDHTPLINMFAKALEVKKEKEKEGEGNGQTESKSGSGISQEDLSHAKELYSKISKIDNILKMVGNGEFSEDEK